MFPSLTLPPALLRCAALNRPNAVAFGSARFQEVSRMPGQGKTGEKMRTYHKRFDAAMARDMPPIVLRPLVNG